MESLSSFNCFTEIYSKMYNNKCALLDMKRKMRKLTTKLVCCNVTSSRQGGTCYNVLAISMPCISIDPLSPYICLLTSISQSILHSGQAFTVLFTFSEKRSFIV